MQVENWRPLANERHPDFRNVQISLYISFLSLFRALMPPWRVLLFIATWRQQKVPARSLIPTPSSFEFQHVTQALLQLYRLILKIRRDLESS